MRSDDAPLSVTEVTASRIPAAYCMSELPRDPDSLVRLVTSLEQELERERDSRARVEDANRRKDEFLAILSHDLRSPLNAVLTWIQVLRSPDIDDETRQRALASLERVAKLQTRMIEDLLDISRIISGKLSLELQGSDLVAIVRSAIETATSAAEEKGVRIEPHIDANCVPMRADGARLQQVVDNLLSNAVKFTPGGGTVKVHLRCPESMAEIRVEDTGEGIPTDVLPHVFDRFRQATSSTQRRGGLGLGLAIARHLVELHGGTIHAHSEGLGRGATFRIALPLLRVAADAEPPPSPQVEHAIDLAGIHVLCVDDDRETCMALEQILRQAGCSVHTVLSVADALRSIRGQPPDVVITDLAMPDQDGYALLEALRRSATATDRPPRVIALTGAAREEDRRRGAEHDFSLYLTKPVEPAELLTAVRMTVSGLASQFARQRARTPTAT
jgi:signal transduction histidine kinase/CheY-like chemotaxis protein